MTLAKFFIASLTVLFIGLKLGNIIDWSWLWVLSPLWAWFGMVLLLIFGGIIFYAGKTSK